MQGGSLPLGCAAMRFEAPDYLNLDELLTEEQKMVRESVRRFVDAEVLPIIADHYSEGTFPKHLIKMIGELGLLGSNLKGYGCAGVDATTYGLIMQELERGDSGIRSFTSVQGSLAMYAIHAYGSEAQKEKWLPRMATGDAIGCFGLTEPDYGSNPSGMLTTAEKRGSSYILNGTKMWITNGCLSELAVIWAKVDGKIRGFIVETDRPGFTSTTIHRKFSLRASVTSELNMSNVEIPEDNLLPKVAGLKGPLGCLTSARYGVAWGTIGAAMACYSEALSYAKQRVQFSRPIAGYQLVQQKLVKMLNDITTSQLMMMRVAQLKESGGATAWHVSMGKRHCVSMALDAARVTRDILGANGIMDEYQCFRHMCNLESVSTYEGTHDIHTLIMGQKITGLAAFE
ncbi:MAG TPA: acyl-CoA dehydrogenase [Myxococcales bacterium]|nr:acyl-CoA dehydrogenase [Myxococcales bacterium]